MQRERNYRQKAEDGLDSSYFNDIDLPEECWTTIPSEYGERLDGLYLISNMGRVKGPSGQLLKGEINYDGYHAVTLIKDKQARTICVHRLVLLSFGVFPPNDMDSPTVQHLNHNKIDNRLENLCWMSAEDNNRDGHATKVHIFKTGKYFASRILASESIGRYPQYFSDCMGRSVPITTPSGEVVEFEYALPGSNTWIKYEPEKSVRHDTPRSCTVNDSKGTHEFNSMVAADRYLGQYNGHVRYRCKHNSKVYNIEGEEVIVKIKDQNREVVE